MTMPITMNQRINKKTAESLSDKLNIELTEQESDVTHSKRENINQQQETLKGNRIRIKKQDPRRKSDTFLSLKNKVHKKEELEMHPDLVDGKMLSKATKVLQEHVKDVTEKTKNNCCVSNPFQQKENYAASTHSVTSVPYIVDCNSGITYVKGRLLGKGGFAKCYELTDIKTNKTYAGKIISKSRLTKPHQREKIAREIDLHKNLKHKHVVGFHSYFEDENNVYIVLENCSRKSLVHVLKSRKVLTEPEARYYLHQLISGTRYIHKESIIHRDLKLGNMLLNEKMEVKIADFGLATKVEYEGEKKMTVCGTPNYIAPEVLEKKGHSYPADVWAMGCVLYALLVGRPPFETTTLKETYMRITSNKYTFPSHISKPVKHFIQKLLHPEPDMRPSLDKIIYDEFFTSGYMPKSLSVNCCDTAPKWPSNTFQRPKSYAAPVSPSEAMHKITTSIANWKGSKKSSSQIISSNNEDYCNRKNEVRELSAPAHSILSEHSRKSSRDRSPHHHHSTSPQSQIADTNYHMNIEHHRPHSRHQHNNSTDNKRHSLSKSPQKVVDTKPVISSSSTNIMKNNYFQQNNNAQLNGYHPGMVLGSKSKPILNSPSQITNASKTSSVPSSPTPLDIQHINQINNAENKGIQLGSAVRLYQLLSTCLEQMPQDSNSYPTHNCKPLWVTKWVDYSNKYGFGFQLSDKSVGVLFNDTTRMLLVPDGRTIQYNDLSNRVYTFSTDSPPVEYKKKSTLLLYFGQYMGEHLIHGGDLLEQHIVQPTSIFMKKWFRTGKAIVMYLNNGTLQVNFFEDHTKVILSPDDEDYLITYINCNRQALTYEMRQFRHLGCENDVAERLVYARKMLESIINIEGETV